MNTISKSVFLFALCAICASASYARQNIGVPGQRVAGSQRLESSPCNPATSNIDLNINDVRARLMNGGDMWWDLISTAIYQVPKEWPVQPQPSSLFAGSIWVGGFDLGGQLKIAAGTYRQNGVDFFPGPLDANGNTDLATCNEWDHHYQVFSTDIAKTDSIANIIGYPIPSGDIPLDMLNWPARGNQFDNDMAGNNNFAPFADVNGDGIYDPTVGDYPIIGVAPNNNSYADQMIWWVYNDKGNIHTETGGEAIGLEVHALAFSFSTNDEVNDMTFYKYTLINKATSVIKDVFMGQWTDPDLGCYDDDYIGCDTSLDNSGKPRKMGICYNGEATDPPCPAGYGSKVPYIALDYFKGPLNENGVELGMSYFLYYNNDFTDMGNPQNATNYYGYLSGKWPDGTYFTQGGTAHGGSVPVHYVFPSSPTLPLPAWSECSMSDAFGDRRMIQSSGPFVLNPGATNDIIVGAVWVTPPPGTYPCPSFALLEQASDKAQALFNSGFKILNGPDAPDVSIVELDQKLVLSLQNTYTKNVELYNESDPVLVAQNIADSTYRFEGYQIYQLSDPSVTVNNLNDLTQARLIFQCDLKDSITNLINFINDPTLGAAVPTLEVTGANLGIQHTFEIVNDAFATPSNQLVNFEPYYFMVVSYAYNNYSVTVGGVTKSQTLPYLQGRRNIKVYSGIPHKPSPESGGMALNSDYGTGPVITTQEGRGNGGNWVELTDSAIATILANNSTLHPSYLGGFTPVGVKVFDPKVVPGGDYQLFLRDSTYLTRTKQYIIKDTTVHMTKLIHVHDSLYNCKDTIIGGKTAIIGGTPDTLADSEIVIVGGRDTIIGGTIKQLCRDTIKGVGKDTTVLVTIKQYYTSIPNNHPGAKDTTETIPKSPPINVYADALDDSAAWTLRLNGDSVTADRNIGVLNEQVIPDWGLSVYIKQVRNPGSNDDSDKNGLIGSSITFANTQDAWLTAIPEQPGENTFNWIRSGSFTDVNPTNANYQLAQSYSSYPGDAGGYYRTVVNGTWAPYRMTSRNPDFGPAWDDYLSQSGFNRLDSLVSVDIVFTADKSKWTQCIVVEANPESNLTEGHVTKGVMRQHVSLDKFGQPVAGIGTAENEAPHDTGYSWFPGYAIDPDDGLRLNIMFAEDSRNVANNGADMLWNPTASLISPTGSIDMGGRHYIYIFRSKYDKDVSYYNLLQPSGGSLDPTNGRAVYKNIAWTTMPLLASGFQFNSIQDGLIPTTTTVKIRVDRTYQRYTTDVSVNNSFPWYTFSGKTLAPITNDLTVAKNVVLDTINIVPNPYYGYSGYETNQLDTRVRITNLPAKCEITIYSLDGVLIRKLTRDDPTSTYLDWDLRNSSALPIASGVYLIHVNVDGVGQRTLKWFGVMRPIDLESF